MRHLVGSCLQRAPTERPNAQQVFCIAKTLHVRSMVAKFPATDPSLSRRHTSTDWARAILLYYWRLYFFAINVVSVYILGALRGRRSYRIYDVEFLKKVDHHIQKYRSIFCETTTTTAGVIPKLSWCGDWKLGESSDDLVTVSKFRSVCLCISEYLLRRWMGSEPHDYWIYDPCRVFFSFLHTYFIFVSSDVIFVFSYSWS